MEKFVLLEQRDLTVAQYEAKFTELSRFAPQLIATKEEKALKFQDGPKPYLTNKISILIGCLFRGGRQSPYCREG